MKNKIQFLLVIIPATWFAIVVWLFDKDFTIKDFIEGISSIWTEGL